MAGLKMEDLPSDPPSAAGSSSTHKNLYYLRSPAFPSTSSYSSAQTPPVLPQKPTPTPPFHQSYAPSSHLPSPVLPTSAHDSEYEEVVPAPTLPPKAQQHMTEEEKVCVVNKSLYMYSSNMYPQGGIPYSLGDSLSKFACTHRKY